MRVDGRDRSRALLCGTDVDQAQDASMANTSDNGQLAEILIERDDGLLMIAGVRQNREIARVTRPLCD